MMTTTSGKSRVYRYSSIPFVLDALARKELALLDPRSWTDKNDSLYVDLYRQYRGVRAVFASCCTLSNETFHHWFVFGGTHGGAFIEYERKDLEACFDATANRDQRIRYEEVKYLTLKRIAKEATPDRLPFLKRWGFQAEEEYRVIVETNDDDQLVCHIPVPISAIRRVVINPWLPVPVVESLRRQIHKIPGCKALKVDHSKLIDNDTWKAAGIRVVTGYRRRHDPAYKRLRAKRNKA